MKQPIRVPTKPEFLTDLNHDDLLRVAMRGHQRIESVLNAAIAETLVQPHKLEIERLGFAIKVDLAIALNILRVEHRALLVGLNRLRNKVAHRPDAAFSADDAKQLEGCLPPRYSAFVSERADQSPLDRLRLAVAVAFVETQAALRRLRRAKIEAHVTQQMANEVLRGEPLSNDRGDVFEEFAARVDKLLAERGW